MEAQRKGILGWIFQERIHELAFEGYMSINQLKESEKMPQQRTLHRQSHDIVQSRV